MTKAEVVNEIAKKTGIEKTVVLATVEAFMDVVKESLSNHKPVFLRGFGSFIIKRRAEKTHRSCFAFNFSFKIKGDSLERKILLDFTICAGIFYERLYRRTSSGDCVLYHREQCNCETDGETIWGQ